MPRTAVTVTALPAGSAIAESAGTTADPTNDHVVTPTGPLEDLVLVFKNTNGSARTATILKGDSPPALSAGQGDLVISVPATSGVRMITGLESARYLHADGTIEIDLETSFAGTVHAYQKGR
jgi:hypothetical protein